MLIWLKAQGQRADSEALFLWFCLEWVGFCRGGVHLCACEIADCGSKAGSSCSCRHFSGIGVHEVPVWQWSECKGRDSAEIDQSGYLFLCKEGLVWAQACWNVSHIVRICRSSFLVTSFQSCFWHFKVIWRFSGCRFEHSSSNFYFSSSFRIFFQILEPLGLVQKTTSLCTHYTFHITRYKFLLQIKTWVHTGVQ